MTDKMDRGLDDIIADSRGSGSRNRRGRADGRRQDYPRDGAVFGYDASPRLDRLTKLLGDMAANSTRNDSRSIDSEWVHDRFQERGPRGGVAPRRQREDPPSKGSKIRVENIHYDLGEDDLDVCASIRAGSLNLQATDAHVQELFTRIGPIVKLQLRYDRAGRSEGTAFVTYERADDAQEAIRQFHGANANGQPIRLSLAPSGTGRNPFDTAVMPGRSLAERITVPGARSRSLSPRRRRYDDEDAARKGIDRYIPEDDGRPRSPSGQRRGGRRPGVRREDNINNSNSNNNNRGRGNVRNNVRAKKTQDELDAEMEDYFGSNNGPKAVNGSADDDTDMIE
ncbi:hypothetical protein CP533_5930 [Ophiocordyceps camponoti-saundersi (nom. inval.)]|nr:hypothetical protein CP533_5930 [Ophiocordyceps camponoti-saundersi (nom. inval.)]